MPQAHRQQDYEDGSDDKARCMNNRNEEEKKTKVNFNM